MPKRPNIMPWLLLTAACSPSEFLWQQTTATELSSYRRSFEDAIEGPLVAACSRDELLTQTSKARVLWLGDHHRSTRLHNLHGELLQALAKTTREVHLLLEAFGTQDQQSADDYLAGELTLRAFADTVRARWPGSWLDDPDLDPWYYRSLCDVARSRRWGLSALEPTPRLPLAQRDERIAARIREIAALHPNALLVVVIGQAHLVGEGDLIARTGLPCVALGGEPPDRLAASAAAANKRMLRSRGELWWFGELFGGAAPR